MGLPRASVGTSFPSQASRFFDCGRPHIADVQLLCTHFDSGRWMLFVPARLNSERNVMKTMNFDRAMLRIFCSLILFATTILVAPLAASAAPITIPPSLSPGSQYRLAFVTSTGIAATSSNIADYNTFVTGVANTLPELAALGTSWSAIASTATTAANDNTNTNPSVLTGYPIFDSAGNLIAANNAALWSGSIAAPLSTTETGGTTSRYIWTGTSPSGIQSGATDVLGGTGPMLGDSLSALGAWIQAFPFGSPEGPGPLYGISGVLTVPVPEPGSIFLTCFAVAGFAASSLRQRRHFNASTHVIEDLH
jgi:hypothetical protein